MSEPSLKPIDHTAASHAFAQWFIDNYPGPRTVISDPGWHAPKIYRAVQRAMADAQPEPAAHPAGCFICGEHNAPARSAAGTGIFVCWPCMSAAIHRDDAAPPAQADAADAMRLLQEFVWLDRECLRLAEIRGSFGLHTQESVRAKYRDEFRAFDARKNANWTRVRVLLDAAMSTPPAQESGDSIG